MSSTKAAFVVWLKQQPDYNDVWTDVFLTGYANGTETSQELDHLHAMYDAGQQLYVQNWIVSESGNSLTRSDWVNWGDTATEPEITFLQAAILNLKNQLSAYEANNGGNSELVATVQNTINSYQTTLQQMIQQQQADLKKTGH